MNTKFKFNVRIKARGIGEIELGEISGELENFTIKDVVKFYELKRQASKEAYEDLKMVLRDGEDLINSDKIETVVGRVFDIVVKGYKKFQSTDVESLKAEAEAAEMKKPLLERIRKAKEF